jgi:hypothetical protein
MKYILYFLAGLAIAYFTVVALGTLAGIYLNREKHDQDP